MKEPTEVFDPNNAYPRHESAHPKGGFHMSHVNDTKTTEVMKSILRKLGQKIIKGEIQNIMVLSKPPVLCKDISYMEIIANDLLHTDWLKLAASVPHDPLFQMKCVIVHTLSSIYISPGVLYMKVPMDNLLGQTCHLIKNDGTQFFGESINTSPPQSLYQIVGPNKSFQVYGSHRVKATIHPSLNTLHGDALGSKKIDFGNGNIFECDYCQLQIQGLLVGDRVMQQQKSFKIKNAKSKLVAEAKFHFEDINNVSKVASSIGNFFGVGKKVKSVKSVEKKKRADDIDIVISKIQELDDGEILKVDLSTGCGNWLEYVQFDGIVYWKMTDKQESWKVPEENLLPSDCQYRIDRELIKKGQYDIAEKQQSIQEERDGKQEEMRKKYKILKVKQK